MLNFLQKLPAYFFFWNKTLSTTLLNVVFRADPKKTRTGKILLRLVAQQKTHK